MHMRSTLLAAVALLALAGPARAVTFAFENGVYGLPSNNDSHVSGDPHTAFDNDQLTISVSDAAVARGSFTYSSVRYPDLGGVVSGDVAAFQGFTFGGELGHNYQFTSPNGQPRESFLNVTLSFGPDGGVTATRLLFSTDSAQVDLRGSGGNSVAGNYVLGANSPCSSECTIAGQLVRLDAASAPMPEPGTLALLLTPLVAFVSRHRNRAGRYAT